MSLYNTVKRYSRMNYRIDDYEVLKVVLEQGDDKRKCLNW
jgi:hypothetical protein